MVEENCRGLADHALVHGDELFGQGKFEEAEIEYRKALRLDPNDAEAHHGLGLIFDERSDFVNAIAEYRAALQFEPNDETRRDLVWALIEEGDLLQARREMQAVGDSKRSDAGLWIHLGEAFEKQGQSEGAIASYKEALEIDPDVAEARANLKRIAPVELENVPSTTWRYVLVRGGIALAALLLIAGMVYVLWQTVSEPSLIGETVNSFLERRVVLQADREVSAAELDASMNIYSKRFDVIGMRARFSTNSPNQIIVRIAGNKPVSSAIWVNSPQGQLLELVDSGDTSIAEGTTIETSGTATVVGPGTPTPSFAAPDPNGRHVYRTVLTGEDLQNATILFNATTKQPYISFNLTNRGREIFADYTAHNIGKFLTITLNKKVISSPRVSGVIPEGAGIIEGQFTLDQMQALVIALTPLQLPVNFRIVSDQTGLPF